MLAVIYKEEQWEAPCHYFNKWTNLISRKGRVAVMQFFWRCQSTVCYDWTFWSHIGILYICCPCRKVDASVRSCLDDEADEGLFGFALCLTGGGEKTYLMKQMVHDPHVSIICLSLWPCLRLFLDILSEKWLVMINSGKKSIKRMCPTHSNASNIESPNVHIYFPVLLGKTWLYFIIRFTLVYFKWECEICENIFWEQNELASLETLSLMRQ